MQPAGLIRAGRQSLSDSLVRNSGYLMAATASTSLLGYVFWVVAARLYPTATIGEAGSGVSAMAFASLLGAVGGSSAIVGELPGKRRPEEWSVTVTTMLVFTSVTSAVTALGTVLVLAHAGDSAFLYRQGVWVAAFVVGVVGTTASQLLENIWVAERQAGWFFGASTFFAAAKLAVVAIPMVVIFGAIGILSAWSAVLTVTVAGCMLALARLYHYRPRIARFRQQIWSMRQTLTGNYLITVGDQVPMYLIPVVVALAVSPVAAGWFYAAYRIGGFYAVFASAVGSATFAEGSHRPHRALSMAISGMKLILPFTALGMIATIVGGKLVLSAFGTGYAVHAYTLLVLLSVAAIPDAVVNIYRSVLRAHRRYVTASAITWGIAGSRLALTWLCVQRFGIQGAGWAWLATQTAGALYCVLDVARHRDATGESGAGPLSALNQSGMYSSSKHNHLLGDICMQCLVTGGCGFIGSALVRRLASEGHRIVVVDDMSRGSAENLGSASDQVMVVEQDVTTGLKRIVTSCWPDVIVHLAALHYIPHCDADPMRCIRVNVDGTRAVLDAAWAAEQPVPVVFASSAAVYAPTEEAHHEDDPLGPIDVYGYSKRWGEELVSSYGLRAAASVGIARLFNVFGPGETNAHFIPSVISQLHENESVRTGNVSSRRDYVFVDDVVDALADLARYCLLGRSLTVNVGSGRSYSGYEILQALTGLSATAGLTPIIDPDRIRTVDRPVLLASNDLAHKALGWAPRTSLLTGLRAAWDRPVGAGVVF